MTFYQELQLGQAGSKNLIRACETPRDRLLHTLIYLFKIALTVGFCFCFVTLYSMAFGSANSIVGVVVLLYLLVFRAADLCLHIGQSTALLASFLVLSAAAPHLAHLAGPLPGFFINLASIAFLILFGCHEPRMFNQSTLVLGYLLLYGYDVSGRDFTLRLAGIAFGALLVCTVFLLTAAAVFRFASAIFPSRSPCIIRARAGSSARFSACRSSCCSPSWPVCPAPCGQASPPCRSSFRLLRICTTGCAAVCSAILPACCASSFCIFFYRPPFTPLSA